MSTQRMRFQVWLEPQDAHQVQRWAQAAGKSLSAAMAYLAIRGLEQEIGTGLEHLRRVCDATSLQVEQLQALIEALEIREAERFRRLLGHVQLHQAQTTELLAGQRVKMLDDRPKDYARAVEIARGQVSEDAGLYRESIAAAGPARRTAPGTAKADRVA